MSASMQEHPSGTVAAVAMGTGERLKLAREAAGLSLDHVAQQLKLASRQVKALEDERFDELPGRTFSRGFVRNYARLLNLDADDLLSRLPETVRPPLHAPSLHSTAATIAELPTTAPQRSGFVRWLIPLLLVACIVGAAAYEWRRNGFATASDQAGLPASRSVDAATTPLPNSLVAAVQPHPPPPAPQAPLPDERAGATPRPVPAAEMEAPLVLTYNAPSWTEIRDRSGQLLVSRLIAQSTVESVRGDAPFELTLGNADAVSVVYLGKPVDLGPYTRQNVARVTLP